MDMEGPKLDPREAMLRDLDIQRGDHYPERRKYRIRFGLDGESVTCIYSRSSTFTSEADMLFDALGVGPARG
jgi:hypothetical protein